MMNAVIEKRPEAIREMLEGDLEAVMRIENKAYPYPWTRGIFSDCLRVGYFCWVYERNGMIEGYGVMSFAVGEAHILNLCVDPEKKGRGIARQLLESLMNTAAQLGADTVLLEVRPSNEAALKLYEKAGFVEVGCRKAYYPADEGREDALILAKHVSSLD